MTPEQRALRDAFLAEMWGYCREMSYGERVEKRAADRVLQREIEAREISTGLVHNSAETVDIGAARSA